MIFIYLLFLGGTFCVSMKYKAGQRVKYNSGILITTNIYPDFGQERDNEAIRRRLALFDTISLRHKDNSVSGTN